MLGRGNIMINKMEGDLKESSLEERVKLKMLFYETRKGFRIGKGAKDICTVLILQFPLLLVNKAILVRHFKTKEKHFKSKQTLSK